MSFLFDYFIEKEVPYLTDAKILEDSSISRLLRKNQENPLAIITAFRYWRDCNSVRDFNSMENKMTYRENLQRNKELVRDLKAKGYDITRVIGRYPEEDDNGNSKIIKEISFVVMKPGWSEKRLRDEVSKLATKYDQESILMIPVKAMENPRARFVYPQKKVHVEGEGEEAKYVTKAETDSQAYLWGTPNSCDDERRWVKPGQKVKTFYFKAGWDGKTLYTQVSGRKFLFVIDFDD